MFRLSIIASVNLVVHHTRVYWSKFNNSKSDKTRRSYNDMFSGLKQWVQKRDLELSASTLWTVKAVWFIFRNAFLWRVKEPRLQQRYSVKSQDPIFGTFVRALNGSQFVKISELNRAIVHIGKLQGNWVKTGVKQQ